MKKLKRILSLGAAAAMLMSCTLTANSEVLKQNSVSTITTTENLKSSSTVYVGEVVVGGVSKMKYIWSADLSHNLAAWNDLKEALSGMEDTDFAGLFPAAFDSESEEKGLKLCNVSARVADMDESWASASAPGTKYYTAYEVSARTNGNLYDLDEGFKAKLDAKKAERVEAYDEPIDNNKTIITHLDSRTVTDVYYTINDGQVVRHSDTNVIYDCEEINVIYTRAEMKVKTNTVINVTGKEACIVKNSTLYVGEVAADGESIRYLWSDDISRTENVFAAVKTALNGLEDKDFAALMPDLIGEEDAKGVAVCSVSGYEKDMNADWTDAAKAAALFYPDKTFRTAESADLYDTDEGFAKASAFEEGTAELVDTAGEPYEQHSPLGKLSAANTDNVTYTVINGKLVKLIDRFIDYTCEAVTVIYTRAEIVDFLPGDVNSDGTVSMRDLTTLQRYINGWNVTINEAAADVNSDGSISMRDLTALQKMINA